MLLSTSLFVALFAQAQMPFYLYVDRRQFDCVVRNIDIYMTDADDPAIVYLDECKQVAKLGALLPARLFPLLPSAGRPGAVPARLDTVISLTRRQMRCLKSRQIRLRDHILPGLTSVYRLPVDFCERPR